ncbi:MAG: maleylpyruvate isomerase family mycothiol-dependent enzyme [Dactylosporangium sp.]|nr:maleylpyruvate isomerase family mycothiol-dependent enzyme [Dactylosporangium sp.]
MTRWHGNKEFWISALRSEAPAFRRAAGQPGALAATVHSCPGWTVEDLVRHLGAVYRWVRSHVSRGVTSRPEQPRPVVDDGVPTGPAALTWWDDEYASLLTMLDRLDPEMPAWNWAPQPKKVAFWHRRMAHETAVHRWDAQMATGLTEPIEAKLAVDGVAEALDSWLPAGRRRGPTDRMGVVQLAATDIDQEWFVRLRGEAGIALLDTATLLDTGDPRARALARGTASDLLLALYGRVPFDVLEVTGDVTLLESLRTG